MRQFAFGLIADRGHVFDPAPGEFATDIRQLILDQAGYGELPTDVPFIGHFPLDRGQYVVLAKPAGEGTFLGWVITDRQYAASGYSPYRFVAAEGELRTELAVEPGGLPPALDTPRPTADPVHHLPLAALNFETFDEARRRKAHRSIAVPGGAVGDAVFVLQEPGGAARKPPADPPDRPPQEQPGLEPLAAIRGEVASLRSAVEAMAKQPEDPAGQDVERRLRALETADREAAAALEKRLAALAHADLDQLKRWKDALSGAPPTSQVRLDDVEQRLALTAGNRWRWSVRWIAGVAAIVVLAIAGGIFYLAGPGKARLEAIETAQTRAGEKVDGQVSSLQTLLADDDHSGVRDIRSGLAKLEEATKDLAESAKANGELVASAKQADGELKEKVDGLSGELDLAKSDLGERLGTAEATATDLTEKVTALAAAIGEGNSTKGSVHKRLEAAEGDATTLSGRVDAIATLLGDAEEPAAGTLLARLEALDATMAAIRTWIEATCKNSARPSAAVAMSKACRDFVDAIPAMPGQKP